MRRNRFSILIAVTMSVVTLVMPFLGTGGGAWVARGQQAAFPNCTNPKLRITKPFGSAISVVESGGFGVVTVDLFLKQANHSFAISPPDAPQKGDTPYVHYAELSGGNIFSCAELITSTHVRFFIFTTGGARHIRTEVYYTKFNADGTRVRKIANSAAGTAFAATAAEAESLARQQAYDAALAAGFQIDETQITVTSSLQSDGSYLGYALVPDNTNQADVVDPADNVIPLP